MECVNTSMRAMALGAEMKIAMGSKAQTCFAADLMERTPKERRNKALLASPQPAVFRYQQKIKEAINPNDLGDAYYTTLDDGTDAHR